MCFSETAVGACDKGNAAFDFHIGSSRKFEAAD
jgi:hypothetical protein